MAIKVYFGPNSNGPYAEADTAEEAAALLKIAAANGHAPSVRIPVSNLTENEAVSKFSNEINDNARRFLTVLAKHAEGVSGDEFAKEVGFETFKFGGILGGASKLAGKFGLSLDSFVISRMQTDGSRRIRMLYPGQMLLKHLDKLLARK